MSYLEIPLTPAVNGQSSVVIKKSDIISVTAQGAATSTVLSINTGVVGSDVLTLTHTAAASGYNVADIIQDAWTSSPGNGVAVIGGIPATVSGTGQALTFVQFSAAVFS